jgi:putative DNA primase/helicase
MLTGQDKIAARALYREWFEFQPEYKLVLYTNFRPKVDGSDAAIWDRIRLIPFRATFDGDKQDAELGGKLAAEAEGILAWLVEGCLEWQDDGLGSCDAVEQATASYRTENDVIGRFVGECCELGDDYRVPRKALRAALLEYCDEGGDDPPPAETLGRWLSDRGVRDARMKREARISRRSSRGADAMNSFTCRTGIFRNSLTRRPIGEVPGNACRSREAGVVG